MDSSHVSKTGSDLNHILFEIIPRLNSGVYIHFHDIFHPFEYPEKWVYAGRNELSLHIPVVKLEPAYIMARNVAFPEPAAPRLEIALFLQQSE